MLNVTLLKTGLSNYRDMWDIQKQLHDKVVHDGDKQYLIITEHKPVITIGKSGSKSNLLADPGYLKAQGIEVVENDRGGDITYHGPGQIIGYPILDLSRFKKDIHWYLRTLEELIIETLSHFNLAGERQDNLTGVWIKNKKICAIGVKTSRWVTMHGFALNVKTNLEHFEMIVPCGISDKGVTSISSELGNTIDIKNVINILISQFQNIFQVHIVPGNIQDAIS